MCGILGSFSNESGAVTRDSFSGALERLSHRGPDDSGVFEREADSGKLFLGHSRLSILDLSENGHQPMSSHSGRYWLTYNGEIYNYLEIRDDLVAKGHVFTTETDSEVLLMAYEVWGEACLKKLVGMFAFCIYDSEEATLFLARDAFGIKPLLYASQADCFIFSSEIAPILAVWRGETRINPQVAYDFLAWAQYDHTDQTFYSDIKYLLPGHCMKVDLKAKSLSPSPTRWWWPEIVECKNLSIDEAAQRLRELFLNSVRLHLRSDVAVGAALSGGLDSSAIVCAMRYLEPQMDIHTFSFIAPESSVDEDRWVDIVNQHVGAISHKITVAPTELAEDLEDMMLFQGEPFGSTSIYAQYRVFKAARDAGIVVMLDGQGADELLAGYNGYPEDYLRSLFDRGEYLKAANFMMAWSNWPGRGLLKAVLILGAALVPRRLHTLARRLIGQGNKPDWLDISLLKQEKVRFEYPYQETLANDAFSRRLMERLRRALTGQGLAALLRHGDRNSMRWSIESRVPFLQPEIAEFLLSLPEHYLISNEGQTKHIFRKAMRGIVPDEILDRKDKIGFQTPEYEWLKLNRDRFDSWLDAEGSASFLKNKRVRNYVDKIMTSHRRYKRSVWGLINYSKWSKNI